MDYKKKLRSRLNIAITYIVLGVIFIVGTFITKTENDFISTFGFMMILMGLVRIRNYRMITKDEDTIRKQQIIETDERNISIIHKAKSAAFAVYTFILGVAVIVLSFIRASRSSKVGSMFRLSSWGNLLDLLLYIRKNHNLYMQLMFCQKI